MPRIFKKPAIPLTITCGVLFALGLLIHNTCSFAESKRPDRGAVSFGAEKKPDIRMSGQMEPFKTAIADIAEKVIPTVVSVIPTKIDTVVFSNNPFYQFFGDPFGGGFDDFFGPFNPDPRQRPRQPNQPPLQKKEFRQQGLGSGVIVSKEGYILTNYHVVAGANEIEIKTSDKRSFQAEVVGLDSLADVAVIKIKEKVADLPVAYLGDSEKLRPGDWAIAVGNPFSLTSSVTLGIISALKRTTGGIPDAYQNFIQTDAAINPGNSGGALVNINGELIGINTMIYSQSGGYMGIGFAIPINMARQIMEDLICEGKVSRGWLGVMIQDLDRNTRDAMGLPAETKGVLIGDVFKGQPADKAGIKRGDIVTSVNDKPVEGANELRNAVAAIHPGAKVPVEILRNGKKVTAQVTLTGRDARKTQSTLSSREPPAEGEDADFSTKLGIKVGSLTPKQYAELGIDKSVKGVMVQEVDEASQAAANDIRPNDIIMEVNRQEISNVKDFRQATKSIKAGDSILLLILRDGNTFFRAFKVHNKKK
ncbi:MAG: DegQ family serine endoprotease [Chitinispirillaceae bacterium]|nr:DegQ family serine endoprotease [Chitinispirillaceae bacterium]